MTIKPQIEALARKMAEKMDELHPDGSLIFMSSWSRPGDEDGYSLIHGDESLVDRSFREMEPIIRRLEGLNLNPSDSSIRQIHKITTDLCEEEDQEIDALFRQILSLLESPIDGDTILIVSWMELGVHYHRYVDLGGMIRGIVGLFNAGIDTFRNISCTEDRRDE